MTDTDCKEDEVLRRMLKASPKPHKERKKKKTEEQSREQGEQ